MNWKAVWNDFQEQRKDNKAWIKEHGTFYPRTLRIGQLGLKAAWWYILSLWGLILMLGYQLLKVTQGVNTGQAFFAGMIGLGSLACLAQFYILMLKEAKERKAERAQRKAAKRPEQPLEIALALEGAPE